METHAQPPRPIDDGRVAQAIVEYTGRRTGAVTYRGPSGREYPFDAGPADRLKYVLERDLERFRSLQDFRVLEGTLIDPEADRIRLLQRSILDSAMAETRRALGEHTETGHRKPSQNPPGRPRGRGFGALLDCLMTCAKLEDQHGGAQAAYDAVERHYRDHGPPPGLTVPPRERFPALRSDARQKRLRAGRCLWYRHPEPAPGGMARS